MNNLFKIIIAGAIATVLQKNLGLNPFSFEGFVFFMFVFIVISVIWGFLFKNKATSKKTQDYIEGDKRVNLYYLSLLKKFTIVVIILFVLNICVNFTSLNLGLFDDEFKYRFDTSKAISLNLKNKKPIKIFERSNKFYFLYKHKNKYYLVKQKDNIMKEKVLTLYTSFYSLDDIFEFIKHRDDFYDIVDNLSPTVYEEITQAEMFYKPLWFSNSIKYIYWLSHENIRVKDKYKKYLQQKAYKKIEAKRNEYKKLLNQDIKAISNEQLKLTIEKLYSNNAFTLNTRYAISLLNEFDKRKLNDKEFLVYQMNLMSYLYLFRTKEKLNKILRKYKMGVVYTFAFLNRQPLDIPKQSYSHVRLVDLKRKNKLLLWNEKIKSISTVDSSLEIVFKDDKNIKIAFEKVDVKNIQQKLKSMLGTVETIEKNFKKRKDTYE